MRISDADASVLLSDDGRAIVATLGVQVQSLKWLDIDVVESEDLGLWIRIDRGGIRRFFLLRWEYILALDIQGGSGKPVGIRN